MNLLEQETFRKIFSVSEITRNLKKIVEKNFDSVWLEGEISNAKSYPSGHLYFTIKDAESQINGVIFKGYRQYLKFDIENGMQALLHGRISLYEMRGQYQIIVDHLEPKGIGALQLAFEQLKTKLKQEGLFAQERKKNIPFLPHTIGIISSLQGAVVHDILSVLKRRFENMHVLIYPVAVQGNDAVPQITEAISYFAETKTADVIIIARGGGSLEDLWAFNSEILARAIAHCPIPTISAIGHETDFTICDFVSDLRAPTPSVAAELCIPIKEELFQKIAGLIDRLYTLVKYKIETDRKILQEYFSKLKLLSPTPILKRGYTFVSNKEGLIIKRKNQLKSGEELLLNFYDGNVSIKILDLAPKTPSIPELS